MAFQNDSREIVSLDHPNFDTDKAKDRAYTGQQQQQVGEKLLRCKF